jgi:hypothetical protein
MTLAQAKHTTNKWFNASIGHPRILNTPVGTRLRDFATLAD